MGTTDGTTATGTTVFGGTLKLHGSFTLPNEALTLSGGTLYSTTDNTWPGSITVTSGSSFQIDAGQTLQANLATSGAVSLGVGGSGTLELTGSNALVTGSGFEVYSTLQVDGSLTGSSVYLHSGAILPGAGTVGGKVFLNGDYGVNGRLQASGTVGDVSSLDRYYAYYTGGTVDPAGPSGTAVLQTGNLQLRGGTLAAQLNGSTPGTGYDQVKVMGEVEVSNATLQVTLGFTPVVGQQFTLIDNDGTHPIVGMFDGYAEGGLAVVGNVAFRTSYVGGTGNDVVLTVQGYYPPTAVVATGGFSFTATEGSNSSAQTVATFTDPNPNKILDYEATIEWGDGNTSTATIANGLIVQSGDTFSIKASHSYTEEGSYTITTSVTHEGLDSNEVTSTATVADAALTATATPVTTAVYGTAFTGELATFTDANPTATLADFPLANVTIQWGDIGSTPSNATSITQTGTTFHVFGSHTYGAAGPRPTRSL